VAKIKSPYWRALFWTAVILFPSYLVFAYLAVILQFDLLPESLPRNMIIASEVGSIPQLPAILFANLLAKIFSRPVMVGPLALLLFNWFFYYLVLLGIFRWRQRRAAKAGTAHL
jgi:hypothetical protein